MSPSACFWAFAVLAVPAMLQPASGLSQDFMGDVTLLLQHNVKNFAIQDDEDGAEGVNVSADDVQLSQQQQQNKNGMRGALLGVAMPKHQRTLVLESGEKVAVRIEKGHKNGTWVPGFAAKNHSAGYYSVRIALGPNGRYETETFVGGALLRKANQAVWKSESDYYASNPRTAKEVIAELEQDHNRRLRLHLHSTGMSVKEVRERMAARDKSKRDRAERAMWEKGCPEGYQAVDGDARGADQFGRGMKNKQDTMDLCAQECNGKEECLSFEWSPFYKTCNLNKVSLPEKKPHFLDFIFCQRLPPAAPPSQTTEPSKPQAKVGPVP